MNPFSKACAGSSGQPIRWAWQHLAFIKSVRDERLVELGLLWTCIGYSIHHSHLVLGIIRDCLVNL